MTEKEIGALLAQVAVFGSELAQLRAKVDRLTIAIIVLAGVSAGGSVEWLRALLGAG